MKKIHNLYANSLRNDEFYGLFSEGVNLAKSITDKEAKQAIADYEESVKNLGRFLEMNLDESAEHQASKLDSMRNSIYVSCRRVAQGYLNFPDQEKAEICANIWKIFNKNPNPLRLNQAQSSGAILNVIQAVRDLGDEELEAIGFKIWIDKLEEVNSKFIDADMERFTERGKRELKQGRKLREACYEAFSVVATAAALKAASGSESCITFIDSMNAAIDAKKRQVKVRSKARPKSSADSGSNSNPGESADNGEVIAQPAQHNSVTARVENAA